MWIEDHATDRIQRPVAIRAHIQQFLRQRRGGTVQIDDAERRTLLTRLGERTDRQPGSNQNLRLSGGVNTPEQERGRPELTALRRCRWRLW